MSTPESKRILLLLSLSLGLLSGCGKKAGTDPSGAGAAPQAAQLKLLNTFEERGDQPRGRFTSILLAGDRILAGTEDGLEVFAWDKENGFQSEAHHPLRASPASKSKVHRIRRGRDEDIWVSSSDGLARFEGTKFKVQEQSGPAKDAADFRGVVWIARSNSIEVYEPMIPKLSNMPIVLRDGAETSDLTGTKQPLAACTVGDTELLVGCQFGLLKVRNTGDAILWEHKYGRWDRVAGNSVIPQDGNSPLPGNRVMNLKVSPDGKLAAACTDGGLATFSLPDMSDWKVYQGIHRVNRSDPIKGIYHEEIPGNVDMPSSDVMDVAFGEKHLYLGTLKGLVIVSRDGPKAAPARVIGLDDGLPSSHVMGLALDPARKVLFVASQYGLAAFQVGS